MFFLEFYETAEVLDMEYRFYSGSYIGRGAAEGCPRPSVRGTSFNLGFGVWKSLGAGIRTR